MKKVIIMIFVLIGITSIILVTTKSKENSLNEEPVNIRFNGKSFLDVYNSDIGYNDDKAFRKTTVEELDMYKNEQLKDFTYYLSEWKNGYIKHRTKFYDFSVTKVVGVYKSCEYDETAIKSSDDDNPYIIYKRGVSIQDEALVFKEKIEDDVVVNLYDCFDIKINVPLTGLKMHDKSTIESNQTYIYDYNYFVNDYSSGYLSYRVSSERYEEINFDQDSFCNGSGYAGTYYLISCKMVEEKNWFGVWSNCTDPKTINFESVYELWNIISEVSKIDSDKEFNYYSVR